MRLAILALALPAAVNAADIQVDVSANFREMVRVDSAEQIKADLSSVFIRQDQSRTIVIVL